MATIYYCRICEELIVDEDELPTVGEFCTKKCEKLFDKYGLEGGRKEFKKKSKDNNIPVVVVPDVPVRNLPSDSIPESTESIKNPLKKKKSNYDDDKNVVFKNNSSFFTFISKNKKQREYEDSTEYFRKQSEIEHSFRDVSNLDKSTGNITDNNTINKQKEQLNRPSSSRVENQRMATPPSRVSNDQRTPTPPPRVPTPTPPPRVDDQRTSIPPPRVDDQVQVENETALYPDLKQNRSPLEDFDSLDINDNNEPPPSYDALFPDPPPQTVKVEKPLPPQPTENKPIVTDQKKPIFTDQKKPIVTDQKKPIITDKKDPVITDKKETTPPLIPPKLPPKVSIPTVNRNSTPPPPPQTRPYPNQFPPNNFSSDSNSYQQLHQFQQFQFQQFQQFQQPPPHLQPLQHQPSQDNNNTPTNTADTYLQEQAFLPSTVYPPPFYATRFNKNNNA